MPGIDGAQCAAGGASIVAATRVCHFGLRKLEKVRSQCRNSRLAGGSEKDFAFFVHRYWSLFRSVS
jgi:hypothetical protein